MKRKSKDPMEALLNFQKDVQEKQKKNSSGGQASESKHSPEESTPVTKPDELGKNKTVLRDARGNELHQKKILSRDE